MAQIPPQFPAPAARLWGQTPPAIFPPLMGLWGVGLGWRALAQGQGALAGLAEAFLGAVAALALFSTIAWLSKPARRPAALIEDLRPLPGRAGVAAAVLGVMLAGAALVPYAPGLASGMVLGAAVLLAALGVLVARLILTGPAEGRTVTPVMHLVFVGYILAPLSLVPLGLTDLARGILLVTIPVAMAIWGLSLRQLVMRIPPAPLRPLLAIHLAPASLFATVAAALEMSGLAMIFAGLALAILATLLVSARWLLAAGITPMWGALTFPAAACATALHAVFGGTAAGLTVSALLLLGASALTLFVALRVFQGWARGTLAAQTNAARV